MNAIQSIRTCFSIGAAIFALTFNLVFAQVAAKRASDSVAIALHALPSGAGQESAVESDSQHAFDFLIGNWKVHLKLLLNPLADNPQWAEIDGTTTASRIWNGRANFDQFEADGPRGHMESMTLRLYNPETYQWNLFWASSKDGVLQQPPMIGGFKDGRGEFFDGELFHDKGIYVRDVWSDITPTSCHFEQSFSNDGGKTWQANWIATYTRTGS